MQKIIKKLEKQFILCDAVEDEENQEDDPGADSDVTDDPNFGLEDSGENTESEGDVEEEESDDESNTEEGTTPNTPPAVEDKVVVEDGMCAMGTFASIIHKMLGAPVYEALSLAQRAMQMHGLNTTVTNNGLINGVTVSINNYLAAINSIDNICVVNLPNLSDSNILELFRRGGQGIVYTGGEVNDLDYGHFRHLCSYLGNGYFEVYDPTTGKETVERFVGNNGGNNNIWRTFYWILYENQ